MLAQLVEQ